MLRAPASACHVVLFNQGAHCFANIAPDETRSRVFLQRGAVFCAAYVRVDM